jgi:hypothetical protein
VQVEPVVMVVWSRLPMAGSAASISCRARLMALRTAVRARSASSVKRRVRSPRPVAGEAVEVSDVAAQEGERGGAVARGDRDHRRRGRLSGVRGAGCGPKDRDRVELVDLPAFGSPVRLVWIKRRWSCVEPLCARGSWTEERPDVAAPRCALTRRAGLRATVQVGRSARPVSQVADELGVAWHTVMAAVELYGTPLIEEPRPHRRRRGPGCG